MLNSRTYAQIVVIGGGIQGCVTALKLAQAGVSVVLLELGSELMTEASGKLEGWLHHGTYHAALAPTLGKAVGAAKDCLTGAAWYRENFPQCISSTKALALTTSNDPKLLEYRWAASGVQCARLTDLSTIYPYVSEEAVTAAYVAADASIDVPALRVALMERLTTTGVQTIFGVTRIRRIASSTLRLDDRFSRPTIIQAGTIILATGVHSEEVLNQLNVRHHLKFRLWRSHLLEIAGARDIPPLFYVDYDRPSLFPQGRSSLIGLNSDNQQIASVAEPADASVAGRFDRSFRDHFTTLYLASSGSSLRVCYKVDIGGRDTPRSVGVFVQRLEEAVWLHLPGKMTTAPVASSLLHHALDSAHRLGTRPT